jgi:type IV conjugative transfer system protein TraE
MDNSFLKQNTQKLVIQRNSFLFFSAVLSVAVVLLSTLLFYKNERTIVIPTSGPSFWLEEKKVSEGYLERMGFFLSDLLLNRSPADVEKKNQIILGYVHPASYHDIRKLLLKEKETILKSHQSFCFRMDRSYQDVSKGTFVVEGEFLVFVGKEGEAPYCAQNERKKYTLQFECQNGKLQLKALKKEGT